MTITAKIIADSISGAGKRITTVEVTYPHFIHGQVMTHRAFSRNAASSRATPTGIYTQQVRQSVASPIEWGSNQRGMQAGAELQGWRRAAARATWQSSAIFATWHAVVLDMLGCHKQIANRVQEPYTHKRVLITATEWGNFFELRLHHDAQPEIQRLAQAIWDAMDNSVPVELLPGQWHLPYIDAVDRRDVGYAPTLCRISAARCARVSYVRHDGSAPTLEQDLALFDRLAGSVPVHASPLEHQAECLADGAARSGNFVGWRQFRQEYVG